MNNKIEACEVQQLKANDTIMIEGVVYTVQGHEYCKDLGWSTLKLCKAGFKDKSRQDYPSTMLVDCIKAEHIPDKDENGRYVTPVSIGTLHRANFPS